MTLRAWYRTMKIWPVQMLALLLVTVSAHAQGIAATATITTTQLNSTTFHYEMTLTNTGTTTIGTFWFAWIPEEGFMDVTPMNIKSPANWTSAITDDDGSIQYVTNDLLQPGATISGFSFDSTESPTDLTGTPGATLPNDVSFIYSSVPLGGPGFQLVPTVTNPLPPSPAAASVLPGGRSVQVGQTATVFANMVNGGPTSLLGCEVVLPAAAPAGLSLTYQTTDPATNAPIGTPNAPVTIQAGATANFVLSFKAGAALTASQLALNFDCNGVASIPSIPGVNTVDLLFSATPIADVIAIAATETNNAIVEVPQSAGGTGAFAIATANVGSTDTITVGTDTGSATLPLTATICQTNPASGACLAAPAATVTLTDTAGTTPTFSVFVNATAPIALDAANARIFVRFKDGNGVSHGATSVAVETN
jgi:hypothetical protein